MLYELLKFGHLIGLLLIGAGLIGVFLSDIWTRQAKTLPVFAEAVRNIALLTSLVTFAATLYLWWQFDPTSAAFQFEEKHAWMPDFGIQYYLGVDGISLLLLVLTGFLTPIALLSSWESVEKGVKSFSFFMLALESAMLV